MRREAANWLVRLQSGRDLDVEQKFRRWHDADASHAAAFERVRKSYEQAGLLRHSTTPSSNRPAPRSRFQTGYALAASVAIILLAGAGLYLVGGLAPGASRAMVLVTRVGEIRQVKLADGSRVTLDTATSIQVEVGSSRRHALVKDGRARFEVAQGSAPFVIEAGETTATAVSGVLDVERLDEASRIEVVAGRADVHSSGEGGDALGLAAGEAVTTARGHSVETRTAHTSADWTQGMLEFNATPLAVAVSLANRYSNEKIILDPALRKLRVTGAFRARDTAGFARALAGAFHLSLVRTSNGRLNLTRS